ncbi:MAG: hypothetical protein WCP11_01155 [Candidatus Saccharibacteria bacterium]
MGKIRRTNQGGSIVLFMVVGIILALALATMVYILVQRGEQARRDQAIAIVDKQTADEKSKTEAESKTKSADTSAPEKSNDKSVNYPGFEVATVAVGEDLPVTGPEMILSELIGAGALSFSISGYLLSVRRQYRSL